MGLFRMKVLLCISCILFIIIQCSNANLLRRSKPAEASEDEAASDESGPSGPSGNNKKPSKFKNARAHIHTDCTGKDCKSSAMYNNITELEEELGPGVKHMLEVKCGAKNGKPCKVKALKQKKTMEELKKINETKQLNRIDKLMKKVKRKKLNEHIMKKMPKLLLAVKAAIKEYDIGMLRKAAKMVKKRSSKEQTVLDDIATKLKTLAAVKTDESGPSGPDGLEDEDEDENEDPAAMPVDKRLHKLENWAMGKLQKRFNDLKNGASGASGSAGLVEKLPLKARIKLLEKRIKNRVLKRVRVLERMQHKELVSRIAKLEKRKAKILGLNVENKDKPGTFSKHKEPGFKDDDNEEKDDSNDSKKNNMSPYEDGKDANGKTLTEEKPEADDTNAGGNADASGASGPKFNVLDDSDSPTYKLTGKEPTSDGDPKAKAGLCANGPCQKKTTLPNGKPIWHRVAELDHGSMPDIIDFTDPNMPTKEKKYGKMEGEDDMSGSSGPAEGEETHKKPKLVSLEDIKEGHKEKPEEMKEITISKATPPEEGEESFQQGFTERDTWNQVSAPMKAPGAYGKALAAQDKKDAAAAGDSKLKSQ
jgi:hypothetical protein